MYDVPMSRLPRRWRSGGGSSAHGRKKSARPAVGSASQGPGNVPQAHLDLGAGKNSASEAPTARPISRRKNFSGQQAASPSAAFRWPPREPASASGYVDARSASTALAAMRPTFRARANRRKSSGAIFSWSASHSSSTQASRVAGLKQSQRTDPTSAAMLGLEASVAGVQAPVFEGVGFRRSAGSGRTWHMTSYMASSGRSTSSRS
jgi:hypothetical protein